MHDVYGINPNHALNMDIKQLFSLLDRESEYFFYESAKNGSIASSPDFQFIYRFSGEKGWAKTQYLPLIDINGNIGGVIGMVHDITERKKDISIRPFLRIFRMYTTKQSWTVQLLK
jgi:PAS domain S-box-containing protein